MQRPRAGASNKPVERDTLYRPVERTASAFTLLVQGELYRNRFSTSTRSIGQ